MIRDKKVIAAIFIFLISGFTNYYIQKHNLEIVHNKFPNKTRFSESIKTQDDWSYISPIQHYLQKNEWRENSFGNSSYFKRSPGYPWFIGIFISSDKKITPQNIQKLIGAQIILQALVPVLLFLLFVQLKISFATAFLASIIWGISPTFNGFTNYTLTESIAPFFVLLFIFLAIGTQKWKIYLSAIVLGYLMVLKPIFLPFLISYFFVVKPFNLKIVGLCILLSVLPFSIWKIRSYNIDVQSISLHPIYHPQNQNVFRLPHQEIFELVKLYNPNGKNFHEWIAQLEKSAQQNQSINWTEALSIFPKNVQELLGEKNLKKTIYTYHESLKEIHLYAQKGIYSQKEIKVVNDFKTYQNKFMYANPFTSFVYTPIQVAKEMILHSNLNLYIFQHHYRNQFWMEALRFISLFIHVLVFILPIIGLFIWKQNLPFIAFLIPTILICIYFIFVQRALEERYTYPFLALLYCTSVITLIKIKNYKKI